MRILTTLHQSAQFAPPFKDYSGIIKNFDIHRWLYLILDTLYKTNTECHPSHRFIQIWNISGSQAESQYNNDAIILFQVYHESFSNINMYFKTQNTLIMAMYINIYLYLMKLYSVYIYLTFQSR